MRSIILSVVMTLASVVGLYAQNRYYVEPVSISEGAETVLCIGLDNEGPIISGQVDLLLPNQIEMEGAAILSDRAKNTHSVTSTRLTNGKVRILFYSLSNTAISGNTGNLFEIKLKAGFNSKGTGQICLSNCIVASGTTEYCLEDITNSIVIGDEVIPERIEILDQDLKFIYDDTIQIDYKIYPENAACKDVIVSIPSLDPCVEILTDNRLHATKSGSQWVYLTTAKGQASDTCVLQIAPKLSFTGKYGNHGILKLKSGRTGTDLEITGGEMLPNPKASQSVTTTSITATTKDPDIIEVKKVTLGWSGFSVYVNAKAPESTMLYVFDNNGTLQDSCKVHVIPADYNKADYKIYTDDGLHISQGEEKEITIYNDVISSLSYAYNHLYFELVLPEGLDVSDVQLAEGLDKTIFYAKKTVKDDNVTIELQPNSKNTNNRWYNLGDSSRYEILKIKINANDNLKDRVGRIIIRNPKMRYTDGSNLSSFKYLNDFESFVLMGDVSNVRCLDECYGLMYTDNYGLLKPQLEKNEVITYMDIRKCVDIDSCLRISSLNPNMLIVQNYWMKIENETNTVAYDFCPKYVVSDKYPVNIPLPFFTNIAEYERNTDNKWQILVSPFDAKVPQGAVIEEFDSMEGNILFFTRTDTIRANTPYLLKTDKPLIIGGDKIDVPMSQINVDTNLFRATLEKTVCDDAFCYTIDDEGRLVECENSEIAPLRGYFKFDRKMSPDLSIRHYDGTITTLTPLFTPGDINDDGKINSTDISLCVAKVLGEAPSTIIEPAADVNADGRYNSTDISLVVNMVISEN